MKNKSISIFLIGVVVSFFTISCAHISAGVKDEIIINENRVYELDKSKIWFGIAPGERNVIVNENLDKIMKLDDFMEYYPENWIEEYDSVNVTLYKNDKSYIEKGKNNILTAEQRNLFNQIDYSSRIKINLYYKTLNSVTEKLFSEEINKTYRVVPSSPAHYIFGLDSLLNSFKSKTKDKLDLSKIEKVKVGKDSIATEGSVFVTFTINEQGKSESVKMEQSSGDKKTDAVIQQLVIEMPDWIPGKNSLGIPVKQEFSLIVTLSSFGWGC